MLLRLFLTFDILIKIILGVGLPALSGIVYFLHQVRKFSIISSNKFSIPSLFSLFSF